METIYEDTPDVWPEEARRGFRLRTASQRAVIAQGDRDSARDLVDRATNESDPVRAQALATAALALAHAGTAEAQGVTRDA